MSSDAVIHAEHLGKRYRLGVRAAARATLRETLNSMALSPYRRLKSVLRGESAQLSGNEIWALKDVSLSVSLGEVVGVIGRNGAGKSTLLKILSRITEPTRGRAEIRGRVGSLLEVGTGFHSELTGRENIFLNGVILGMSRAEVAAKLDQIVAFSDVERFLDTQVKHYSSGMSLRLAFAVAAHLQPEILLVDEVLAVGDLAFQRKCLGKMSEVAHEGRAILFVSHNLEAVQRLCDRCIWIEGGQVQMDGETGAVVRAYVEHGDKAAASYQAQRHMSDAEPVVLWEAALLNTAGEPCDAVCFGEPFSVKLQWGFAKSMADVEFVTQVRDSNERLIFSSSTEGSAIEVEAGTFTSTCHVRENILRPGDYALTVSCMRGSRTRLHRVERCLRIRVLEVPARGRQLVKLHREALVAPDTRWDASIAEPAAATR